MLLSVSFALLQIIELNWGTSLIPETYEWGSSQFCLATDCTHCLSMFTLIVFADILKYKSSSACLSLNGHWQPRFSSPKSSRQKTVISSAVAIVTSNLTHFLFPTQSAFIVHDRFANELFPPTFYLQQTLMIETGSKCSLSLYFIFSKMASDWQSITSFPCNKLWRGFTQKQFKTTILF